MRSDPQQGPLSIWQRLGFWLASLLGLKGERNDGESDV